MKKDDYITIMSASSGREGRALLEMMDTYNVNSLQELSKKQVEKYYRKWLLNNILSISAQLDIIKEEMCDNYCKIPFKYSVNEWEKLRDTEQCPCRACPLNGL